MNNDNLTKLTLKRNYLQFKCKKCQTDLTNIKQIISIIPVELAFKSFYLKNIKFSSLIRISKDKSYGFYKCKCFNCKALIGKYIIMGSFLTKHLLTSIIVNDNVQLNMIESEEDLLNTKYETNLINANTSQEINSQLINHFNSKVSLLLII